MRHLVFNQHEVQKGQNLEKALNLSQAFLLTQEPVFAPKAYYFMAVTDEFKKMGEEKTLH